MYKRQQSDIEREAIARTMLNRVKSGDYPSNIKDVVYQENAFSCIGSNNWKESKFKTFRNNYEEQVYQQCQQAVKNILRGKQLGIPREDKIIAFYSGKKCNDAYWNSLEDVSTLGDMTFCAPKKEKK